jgi:hypothetical protein
MLPMVTVDLGGGDGSSSSSSSSGFCLREVRHNFKILHLIMIAE